MTLLAETAHVFEAELGNDLVDVPKAILPEQQSVEFISDIRAFERLRDEWYTLPGAIQLPYLSYEWFVSAASAFHADDRLLVSAVRTSGRLSGVAPFIQRRTITGPRLETIGGRALGEPSGIIYRDSRSLGTLLQVLAARDMPLTFFRIPVSEGVLGAVRELPGRFHWWSTSASPWLPVNTTWEDLERRMSSRWRSTLRRDMKRAESLGIAGIDIAHPDPSQVDVVLEEFANVEQLGWKGHQQTSLRHDAALMHFFRLYFRYLAPSGRFCVFRSRAKSGTSAIILGVIHDDRLWILKTAYDPEFLKCSPGILLMHEAVRSAFRRRLRSIEFLGVDEPWIHVWTRRIHAFVTCRVFPRSATGAAAFSADAARICFQKMRKNERGGS